MRGFRALGLGLQMFAGFRVKEGFGDAGFGLRGGLDGSFRAWMGLGFRVRLFLGLDGLGL